MHKNCYTSSVRTTPRPPTNEELLELFLRPKSILGALTVDERLEIYRMAMQSDEACGGYDYAIEEEK